MPNLPRRDRLKGFGRVQYTQFPVGIDLRGGSLKGSPQGRHVDTVASDLRFIRMLNMFINNGKNIEKRGGLTRGTDMSLPASVGGIGTDADGLFVAWDESGPVPDTPLRIVRAQSVSGPDNKIAKILDYAVFGNNLYFVVLFEDGTIDHYYETRDIVTQPDPSDPGEADGVHSVMQNLDGFTVPLALATLRATNGAATFIDNADLGATLPSWIENRDNLIVVQYPTHGEVVGDDLFFVRQRSPQFRNSRAHTADRDQIVFDDLPLADMHSRVDIGQVYGDTSDLAVQSIWTINNAPTTSAGSLDDMTLDQEVSFIGLQPEAYGMLHVIKAGGFPPVNITGLDRTMGTVLDGTIGAGYSENILNLNPQARIEAINEPRNPRHPLPARRAVLGGYRAGGVLRQGILC